MAKLEPQRYFQLQADAEFFAFDIDDAIAKLAAHFAAIRDGKDSALLVGGSISIGLCPEAEDEAGVMGVPD